MARAKLENRIMDALKKELKSKGLHNHDIAASLGVSEGTVKRYFSGKGVTLTVLAELAELAELDLVTLAELAESDRAQPALTIAQEATLGSSKPTAIAFFLLRHGWSPQQIAEEFSLAGSIESILLNLETAGLIRRLAQGIKVLAAPNFEQGAHGWLGQQRRDNATGFLSEFNLNEPQVVWSATVARLSPTSRLRVRDMIHAFITEMNDLTEGDRTLSADEVQWFRLFAGALPVEPRRLI